MQSHHADGPVPEQSTLPAVVETAARHIAPSFAVPFWHTRYGTLLAKPGAEALARSLSAYGEWAEQELDVLGSVIEEGAAVLEYGAERGVHTLALARLVGPAGRVYVVEPDRLAHIALCSTLALNELEHVYPIHAELVAASSGVAKEDERTAEPRRPVTLDALGVGKLGLIKVNRQGGLLPLLAGATQTLQDAAPLLYFRLSNADLATDEIASLKASGYRCWSHLPYLYSARNFAGNTTNIFPGWVNQNVIAAHRDMPIEFTHLSEL